MFRSSLCVAFLGVSFCSLSLLLSLSPVSVLVSAQTSTVNLLEVNVDRVTATTARLQFLNAQISQQTHTLIQYTPNAAVMNGMNRFGYHACATFASSGCPAPPPVFTPSEDLEVNITQGTRPITHYILRGLKPSTTYQVRVAYIDTSNPPQVVGTAGARAFTTEAVSTSTTVSSLVASGGCGSLTNVDGSTSTLYNLTTFLLGSERIYRCDVVFDITNVTLSVIPPMPYALITPNTTGTFTQTIQPLSLNTKLPADPFLIYTTNITLGVEGSITNFSFIVTSESNITQIHTLSIHRVIRSTTSTLRGPTSPVTAMIRSPSVPSSYDYRALLWEGTTVGPQSWKVWSDDLSIFPFSSFNITFPLTTSGGQIDYTLLRVLVSPNAAHSVSGSCSNIHVGLFHTSNQRSSHAITCVTAINDYCSTTPAGVATKWTSYIENGVFNQALAYNPPPPTPTFPLA